MFPLSQRARYSLKTLLMLARQPEGSHIQAAAISSAQKIPRRSLEPILVELCRRGMIYHARGKSPGYALRDQTRRWSLARVLEATQGPQLSPCCMDQVSHCADCDPMAGCEIREIFSRVWAARISLLEQHSLAMRQRKASAR